MNKRMLTAGLPAELLGDWSVLQLLMPALRAQVGTIEIPIPTSLKEIMKLVVPSTNLHRWRSAHNLLAAAATIFAAPTLSAQASRAPLAPVVFHVSLGQASATPVSGRLLVFAK